MNQDLTHPFHPPIADSGTVGGESPEWADDAPIEVPFIGDTIDAGNGVIIGLVDVTPELAESWLGCNKKNRNFSDETANRYTRDITKKRWPFTGDPVRFSDDWRLLDGQHRLTAITVTGITLRLLVVIGLAESTQAFMDSGTKRHAAGTLAIQKVPNYTAVASLVRLSLMWNPSGLWDPSRGTQLFGSHLQVSTAEITEFVDEHPAVHEAARVGVRMAYQVAGAKPSVIGATYLRATALPGGAFDAAEWFHRLETGADLTLGDPVLALRNGVLRTRSESLQNSQRDQLWKVIRAWNASRDGQDMSRINMTTQQLGNDNFPDMR